MNAPPPFAPLIGHAGAERLLAHDATSGRLHHAWLFSGPAGIGKATLARRFACWLLAGQPGDTLDVPANDPVARRVAVGTHADLLVVQRAWDEKKQRARGEIVVEDTRRVTGFLRRTAAEGGWRIVIIDEAEAMNRSAANALLKVLEEPPARTVLILVTATAGTLLPTLRSRCRTLSLRALEPAAMDQALIALLPSLTGAERAHLARRADGAPGRAAWLAGERAQALLPLVDELLARRQPEPARDVAIADAVLRQEEGFATFLELLSDGISAQVREQALRGVVRRPGQPDLGAAWQGMRRLADDTERFNLEKRQALLSSLSLLSES